MPANLIIFAIQKAVDNNVKTANYVKGILKNWQKNDIKTLAEAKTEDERFRTGKKTNETEEEANKRKIAELEQSMAGNNDALHKNKTNVFAFKEGV